LISIECLKKQLLFFLSHDVQLPLEMLVQPSYALVAYWPFLSQRRTSAPSVLLFLFDLQFELLASLLFLDASFVSALVFFHVLSLFFHTCDFIRHFSLFPFQTIHFCEIFSLQAHNSSFPISQPRSTPCDLYPAC